MISQAMQTTPAVQSAKINIFLMTKEDQKVVSLNDYVKFKLYSILK